MWARSHHGYGAVIMTTTPLKSLKREVPLEEDEHSVNIVISDTRMTTIFHRCILAPR